MMFGRNVKLMVYPATNGDVDGLYSCENFLLPPNVYPLFQYLLDNKKIEDIKHVNKELLTIYSDDVLELIHEGNDRWEDLVPNKVAKAIKKQRLFTYTPKKSKKEDKATEIA
jgi:hypothetical protein